MIKVYKQLKTKKYSLLLLDSPPPITNYSKILIDGVEYMPEIVYDLNNAVAVADDGDFEGKEIKFLK